MDFILKSISYVLHPLIMPLLGVLFYFSKTPRFIPENIVNAKIKATASTYSRLICTETLISVGMI